MRVLAASLLISAACASAAAAQPPARETRVAWSERPSHVERCQMIAAEYRALRQEGRLHGQARRDVLQRFHRTGCMGEPLFQVGGQYFTFTGPGAVTSRGR